MKKVLIGTALGLAGAYAVYRLHKNGAFDGVYDNLNVIRSKTKRNIKNAVDVGINQAEYIKDRIGHEFQSGVEKLTKSAK